MKAEEVGRREVKVTLSSGQQIMLFEFADKLVLHDFRASQVFEIQRTDVGLRLKRVPDAADPGFTALEELTIEVALSREEKGSAGDRASRAPTTVN